MAQTSKVRVADRIEDAASAVYTAQLELLKAIQDAGDTDLNLVRAIKEARQEAVNLHVGLQQLSRQVSK